MPHLCGCYSNFSSSPYGVYEPKDYLPLLDSQAHTTILSTTSKTLLKQSFSNPSTSEDIKECIYIFPLYDGVSVVGFTCKVGSRVLRGIVKEKAKAQHIFDAAVAKGETAGLLVQAPEASDVFSTKLGNIPAGEKIIVEITYIGELKHDDVDGIRFMIPTRIAPRYGAGPSTALPLVVAPYHADSSVTGVGATVPASPGRISITVDINLPEGLTVKGLQSPSHPIAVSMGTLSTAAEAQPVMNKACATLSLGSSALERDFVLIVKSKGTGIPKALLETHPTIQNHRALMATLVPRFNLPPCQPEIVFVTDRSGSMRGNIPMLISAMKVFLKSMPTGIKFNICSFGTSHAFLWPKSKSYNSDTLQEAMKHISSFQADFGGTETYGAITATVTNRLGDLPLEIILLTDGDIWNQAPLFAYVNEQVNILQGNIRVFPLGIGAGVSHSLIEGLARAGNGFAQAVQDGERLDNSVVRMLRGALSQHITDYTLEVKYEQDDDDFELIEKVTDGIKNLLADSDSGSKILQIASEPTASGMKMRLPDGEFMKSKPPNQKPDQKAPQDPQPTISLYDPNFDPNMETLGTSGYAIDLPNIRHPKLLQAPHKIPSLIPFSRTTVYILMGPETIQRNPTSVILRATCSHGPLAIEIPIEVLSEPDQTIHKLAARKASQDLEESRGWVFDGEISSQLLIKDQYPGKIDAFVQKEAVRLGETFQVANKWCSFVAVSSNDGDVGMESYDKSGKPVVSQELQSPPPSYYTPAVKENPEPLFFSSSIKPKIIAHPFAPSYAEAKKSSHTGMFANRYRTRESTSPKNHAMDIVQPLTLVATSSLPHWRGNTSAGSDSYYDSEPLARPSPPASAGVVRSAHPTNLFGQSSIGSSMGNPNPFSRPGIPSNNSSSGLYGSVHQPSTAKVLPSPSRSLRSSLFGSKASPALPPPPAASRHTPQPAEPILKTDADKVLAIIDLQSFDGSWDSEEKKLSSLLGFEIPKAPDGLKDNVWVTVLVIVFLETKMSGEEGMWGLIVDKARGYVLTIVQGGVDELENKAGVVVRGGRKE